MKIEKNDIGAELKENVRELEEWFKEAESFLREPLKFNQMWTRTAIDAKMEEIQDVCHIWELGGGTLFTKLLETPLSPLKLPNIHVVIMVDLSKPEELWFTLETLIGMLQSHLDIALKNPEATQNEIEEKLLQKTKANIDSEHPDKDLIRPFPL